MAEFGEKLRKQREQRGITLEAVSNTTKIGTRMLKALEEERFDQLPGGVFNKGFVRAYARQIGLDAEEAVNDYLAALRESQAQAQAIMPEFRALRSDPVEAQTKPTVSRAVSAPEIGQEPPPPAALPHKPAEAQVEKLAERVARERPRKKLLEERPAKPNLHPGVRIPWGIVAIALLVVALLLAFLSYHPQAVRRRAVQPQKPAPETQLAASPAEAKPAQQKETAAGVPPSGLSSPAPSLSTSPASTSTAPPAVPSPSTAKSPPPSSTSAVASPGASAASSENTPPPSTASTEKRAAPADTSSPPAQPEATAAAPPAARNKATGDLTLLIRAEQTSWVSITADGKPVAQETLIAPAGKSVRATQEIVVRAGNAGGLVFVLNGKTLPKQGEASEVRTFTFDSQGMHVIIPPPSPTP